MLVFKKKIAGCIENSGMLLAQSLFKPRLSSLLSRYSGRALVAP
jgi:hypothetical protein